MKRFMSVNDKWLVIAFSFIIWHLSFSSAAAQTDSLSSIVDEVVWVVGDEAILKSDIEVTRIQAAMEGIRWNGNPDCAIPEQIAVQKLFLHQAVIDSVDKDVTDADVAAEVELRLEYMIEQIGSREKLEEYYSAKRKVQQEVYSAISSGFSL